MLDLLQYRRTTHAMYAHIRALGTGNPEAHAYFRATRDDLFANHSQSPLAANQRAQFTALDYYPYDPAYRVVAELYTEVERIAYDIDLGADGAFRMVQFAQVAFKLPTGEGSLGVFWIEGYGGGVFLPFRDATNKKTTYGGGRYLLDTIKGADLGHNDDALVLDFNYAYHPSCHYNPNWVCPLAPLQNHLQVAVPVGEQALRIDGTDSA